MSLPGYTESAFSYRATAHTIYRRGTGPGVIVIHESPGILPEVARFGDWVAEAGFTVVLPNLFGTPGKPFSLAYWGETMAKVCISREFSLMATKKASPVTDWLRALSRSIFEELGGKGVGVVGMCLTGNFALSMMADPWVMAPVVAQPSLPLGTSHQQKAALHLSDEELATVKRRTAEGTTVLGVRFSGDLLCPAERFVTLRRELGAGFEGIEIDSSLFNPHGIHPAAHSVLTRDLTDRDGHPTAEARDRVIAFLKERLL